MATATQQDPPTFDTIAAGKYLGREDPQVARRFIYRLVAERRIGYVKTGGLLRFRKSSLDLYLAAHSVAPATLSDADRTAVKRTPRRQGHPRRRTGASS